MISLPVNKVIYGGSTLIDLSEDTVSPDKLLSGFTAHDKTGTQITGTAAPGGGSLADEIVAGDTPVLANWSSKKVSSTTETDTGLLITVTKAGTYRFKIPCYAGSSYSMSGGGTVYIYQNGVKVVTCTLSSSAINLLSEEIACDAGDTISVYAAGTSSGWSTSSVTVFCVVACVEWTNGF